MGELRESPLLHVNADDLGIAVQGDDVLVPSEVAKLLKTLGVTTPAGLQSVLSDFPTALGEGLNLKAATTRAACEAALAKMRPDGISREQKKPSKRGFGALAPQLRPKDK